MDTKKSFKTLIKLKKTFVDEQRQLLARLYENLDRIEAAVTQLQETKAREQATAARDYNARMTFGPFLKLLIQREHALDEQRRAAQREVHEAQDKLAELFEEQKRFEIAEEQRLEEIAREERRLETIELDEIGGTRHERNKA